MVPGISVADCCFVIGEVEDITGSFSLVNLFRLLLQHRASMYFLRTGTAIYGTSPVVQFYIVVNLRARERMLT